MVDELKYISERRPCFCVKKIGMMAAFTFTIEIRLSANISNVDRGVQSGIEQRSAPTRMVWRNKNALPWQLLFSPHCHTGLKPEIFLNICVTLSGKCDAVVLEFIAKHSNSFTQ